MATETYWYGLNWAEKNWIVDFNLDSEIITRTIINPKTNNKNNRLCLRGSWHLHFWVIFKCKGCFDDCRDLHSRISVTEFSYKLCFLCMHELIPEPVTHIRSRKNYNNISNAKTGMFGLARKLITKCHNRLESTLYNRQGVYPYLKDSHGPDIQFWPQPSLNPIFSASFSPN